MARERTTASLWTPTGMEGQAQPTCQIICPQYKDTIVPTDKSQLHLGLLADARPIHLWAGMNAGCPSLENGNTVRRKDIVGQLFCILLQAFTFSGPALKMDFCLPLQKDTTLNLLQLHTKGEYSTFKQFSVYLYNALFI